MTPLDVISLADAKAFLKVDFDDDDTLIESIISSAVNVVEQATQYRLYQRTETMHSDGRYNVDVFLTPLNSLQVQTIDGTAVTWPQIKREPVRTTVVFIRSAYNNAWRSNFGFGDGLDNGVALFGGDWGASLPLYNIVLDVGYTNTSLIPFALLQAAKTLITFMYENRDVAMEAMPNNVLMELQSYNRSPMF